MSSDAVDRLNVALIGRYVVEREIGSGGMATVYLADDLKHGRKVALKVLRPELAAAVGGDRFLAEIRTTANLQHPLILPLFDSGEADGLLYYVMPYVEGESLRTRLDRERQLDVDAAVRIASDVAEALQAAHEQGVVHRDVKPANVLLSRGRALVADFGIARVAETLERPHLTRTGSSVGTTGYMSPEQAMGENDVDHRSDIYSLGCMLYEMLAGEPPYAGPTLMVVLARQATEPVPSLSRIRQGISPTLERVVSVALAKEASDRFDSAASFAEAMKVTPSVADLSTPAHRTKTVIVLPFANRSPDPKNEFFSDGLTEEVISDLSRVSALRVISRNSAMALKGTTKGTAALAAELGVSHLITGSVRRAGDALRVTVELVEAKTDTPVWSEKYTGSMGDVFGIQEEVSRKIVSALEIKLTDTEERQVAERPIEDVVAYDCLLRARHEMYLWTPESQRRALQLVDRGMETAGESPLLLATAAQIHWVMLNGGLVSPPEGLTRARELVERALTIDPSAGLAVFVRGLVAGFEGKRKEALKDLYRAKDLVPGDSTVMGELCRYSNSSGLRNHWRYVEEVARTDPLSFIPPFVESTYRWLNGPREYAAPAVRRAIELAPTGVSPTFHVLCGWQIAEAGFPAEAKDLLSHAVDVLTNSSDEGFARFLLHALEGNESEAVRSVTPEVEKGIGNEFHARLMADGYALLGLHEKATSWVRRAVEFGFLHWPNLAEEALFLEDLRGYVPYQKLLDEVKPRWEALVEWERSLD